MVKKINNWRIILSGDAYTPPECTRFHLQGEAVWVTDGSNRLTSSAIVNSEDGGQVLITRSGSRYHLGNREHSEILSLAEMVKKHPYTPLT